MYALLMKDTCLVSTGYREVRFSGLLMKVACASLWSTFGVLFCFCLSVKEICKHYFKIIIQPEHV